MDDAAVAAQPSPQISPRRQFKHGGEMRQARTTTITQHVALVDATRSSDPTADATLVGAVLVLQEAGHGGLRPPRPRLASRRSRSLVTTQHGECAAWWQGRHTAQPGGSALST